jgi:hypothetical protein
MKGDSEAFLHLLLFQCRKCGEPLATPVKSGDRGIEWLDGAAFDLRCECGWSERLLGILALRHWVTEWPNPPL